MKSNHCRFLSTSKQQTNAIETVTLHALTCRANSAISSVAISGFLPLLVQELSLRAANFPWVCPNLVLDQSLVDATFPGGNYHAMYAYNDMDANAILPSSKCVLSNTTTTGIWCPGLPPSSDQCLQLSGKPDDRYTLSFTESGKSWEPSAYASAMISIGTALQMLFFVSVGGISDYGRGRKILLVSLSLIGCLITILAITVTRWVKHAGSDDAK